MNRNHESRLSSRSVSLLTQCARARTLYLNSTHVRSREHKKVLDHDRVNRLRGGHSHLLRNFRMVPKKHECHSSPHQQETIRYLDWRSIVVIGSLKSVLFQNLHVTHKKKLFYSTKFIIQRYFVSSKKYFSLRIQILVKLVKIVLFKGITSLIIYFDDFRKFGGANNLFKSTKSCAVDPIEYFSVWISLKTFIWNSFSVAKT